MASLSLRQAAQEDDPFLLAVYAGTREQEISSWGWSGEQAIDFIRMQYDMQKRSYAMQYPDASSFIIEAGGSDAGRLIVERSGEVWRIIDISILPGLRNQGIGSGTLAALQEECKANCTRIALRVLKTNPARRLYERLGFRVFMEGNIDLELIWEGK